MEHIAAIMVLVGCMQGDAACREVPTPVVGFETVEECHELLSPSIEEVGKAFKSAYGKCAEVDPALFVEDATIEWRITPSRQLEVKVIADDGTYAVAARTDENPKLRN
ncbi:hypothetical protein BLJAPNOD_03972 [Ensifer sp. M14]|jgi:hypothetical protein|uniref:hypothetical protein n=1 Tax=Ensifer sp. M14 TaxID=2203782 RepID=UPI000E1C7360|nr:hypothetical protein [Ensifer sp. M14]RDL52808.1 hypothetical protein BLJAPNOD_03972 [Ensifer sp. M14]